MFPVEQSLGRLTWLHDEVEHPSDAKNEIRLLLLLYLGFTPSCVDTVDIQLLTGDAFDGRQMLKGFALQIVPRLQGHPGNLQPKP